MEKNKNYGHLMLDLETMGNKSNAVMVSIGAVEFDMKTGKLGREFYERVDIQSCLDAGLIVNGSTITWWLKQNETARHEIAKGGLPLVDVLHNFCDYMAKLNQDVQVWGNGARFDIGILEDSYEAVHLKSPWDFRGERDVRTLVSLRPKFKSTTVFDGIHHYPISDCKHQIKYCSKIWNKLSH